MIAFDALDLLSKSLKVGKPISDAYIATKNLIEQRKDGLQFPNNFGFGIGSQFKEEKLLINAKNTTLVEPGMVFHIRVTLTGVHKEPARSFIGIGDTVVIEKDGSANVVTAGIHKKYSEISYSLDDEEEVAPKKQEAQKPAKKEVIKEQKKPAEKPAPKKKDKSSEDISSEEEYDGESGDEGSQEIMKQGLSGTTMIRSSRLRSKANNQKEKQGELEDRKQHQVELLEKKKAELKIRFNKGEIKSANAKTKVKCMDTFQAYKTGKDFPKDLVPG